MKSQWGTVARFKLDCTEQQAYDLLVAAYNAEVLRRHTALILDGDTASHIRSAANALVSGNKFGMAFCGHVGNGKTTLMAAIRLLVDYLFDAEDKKRGRHFEWMRATDIAPMYEDRKRFKKLCEEELLAIDDFGCEPVETLSYGNVQTPTVELIMRRYEAQRYTIVTTNIAPDRIKERYGVRVADRMREMMHIIPFENKTYRT